MLPAVIAGSVRSIFKGLQTTAGLLINKMGAVLIVTVKLVVFAHCPVVGVNV